MPLDPSREHTVHCRPLLALALLVALGACDFSQSQGPCLHEYRDPLFELTRASDAGTSAALSRVVLRDLSINGVPAPVSVLAQGPFHDIGGGGDSLVCEIACGFGVGDGVYRFRVTAPGYQPLLVERDARHPSFVPGCPSFNSGSVELQVALTRAP